MNSSISREQMFIEIREKSDSITNLLRTLNISGEENESSQNIMFFESLIKLNFTLEKVLGNKSIDQKTNIGSDICIPQNPSVSKTNSSENNLKKNKKKVIKTSSIIHLSIQKNHMGHLLELINSSEIKLDANSYRQITLFTFDFLPQISQKISPATSNKELYTEILTMMIYIMTYKKENLIVNAKQKLVGVPDIVPMKYGLEGPLFIKTKSKEKKKSTVIKKGLFYFEEDSVQIETIRLLKKIYTNSNKQLQIIMNSVKSETSLGSTESPVKEIFKEIRENILSKIFLYKTSLLSFILFSLMEEERITLEILKSREFNLDYFNNFSRLDTLQQWELNLINKLL